MKYSETRAQIKSGDIIALSHYKWASLYDIQIQIVRISTESEYCHVGLVWDVGGRLFVFESVEPYIRMVPLSLYAEDGFYWQPQGVDISEAELKFALAEVGFGVYSKLEAVLAQVDGIEIGADDLWECAEFLIACRRLSGVDLGPKATPAAVMLAGQNRGLPVYFVKGE